MVTDNLRALAPVQQALMRAGFRAVASPATEGDIDRALAGYPPDLCIVDMVHSRLTHAQTRHHLSRVYSIPSVPMLLLASEDHLPGLGQCSPQEDFSLHPVRPPEVVTRVQVLLWRCHRADPSHLLTIGDLVIDQGTYQVRVGDQRLELTYKEYELLRFLASHRGHVFTREALLSHVWGYDYYGGVRTVDVHVRRVRAKLGSPTDALLETVRNVGYRFAEPEG